MPKFCLDSNVLVDALRDPTERASLQQFLAWALPSTFLSAVVVQELEAGASTAAQTAGLEELLIGPFERRGRLFAPTTAAWRAAGRLLAVARQRSGPRGAGPPRSLVNDMLLGISCCDLGLTLVTRDTDFRRIAGLVRGLQVAPPWPRAPRPRKGA